MLKSIILEINGQQRVLGKFRILEKFSSVHGLLKEMQVKKCSILKIFSDKFNSFS
tara:strand:+ start:105 stop:269 length:165 start_codon:yes stop_codon:yes gene_type:complete